jgi:hypothetical protein
VDKIAKTRKREKIRHREKTNGIEIFPFLLTIRTSHKSTKKTVSKTDPIHGRKGRKDKKKKISVPMSADKKEKVRIWSERPHPSEIKKSQAMKNTPKKRKR